MCLVVITCIYIYIGVFFTTETSQRSLGKYKPYHCKGASTFPYLAPPQPASRARTRARPRPGLSQKQTHTVTRVVKHGRGWGGPGLVGRWKGLVGTDSARGARWACGVGKASPFRLLNPRRDDEFFRVRSKVRRFELVRPPKLKSE